MESFISRIKKVNGKINAVVDRRFEEALKEAREIDRRIAAYRDADGKSNDNIMDLPLAGVPVTIKETISLANKSFTAGIKSRRLVKASKNAIAVDRLMKNGLIPIASTNVPEMAMWWDSSNPVYGRSCNPYDLSRITGGSSGGEGAILAAAGSVVGLGSDIAGSIRIPCNFCGIFGHKPTPFVVPTEGMYPLVNGDRLKLLGMGPMCRYACDLLPMLKILADDKASKLNLDIPVDLHKIKIFFCEDIGDALASKPDKDIIDGMRAAVEHLVKKFKINAQLTTFDEFKYGLFLWSVEATITDAPTMAVQFKEGRGELKPLLEAIKKCCGVCDHTINSICAATLEKFTPPPGSKPHRILSEKAAQLREKFYKLLGDDGVFIMPAHPEAAVKHNATLLKVLNTSYTALGNCLQAPITQCPLGMNKEGLPYGVQLVSKRQW